VDLFHLEQERQLASLEIASDTGAEKSLPQQLTRHGGFAAFESLDGKTVYYAKDRDVPGLWRTQP